MWILLLRSGGSKKVRLIWDLLQFVSLKNLGCVSPIATPWLINYRVVSSVFILHNNNNDINEKIRISDAVTREQ
jgi:hypothetical protein